MARTPPKRPSPSHRNNSGRPRSLTPGSPPPTDMGVAGEGQPCGDPPYGARGVQLHLFVVVYVMATGPEPVPEPEPEPEDPGHQLPLPGFPDTPADHLAAARAALAKPRREPRTKRPA